MVKELVCWKCGASLRDLPQPLARLAECEACGAELYVCRMCHSFDPYAAEKCRDERAEPPLDKDRANFCDYFVPRPHAYEPADDAEAQKARAQLEALFGASTDDVDTPSPMTDSSAETEKARQELEKLFGGKGGNGY